MVWPFPSPWPQQSAAEVNGKSFDYIVVGGGTAACVVASRLSEDPSVSVLLISRGAIDDSYLQRSPLFSSAGGGSDWQTLTLDAEPDERWLGGRLLTYVSAATGGATAVNGLLYTRGAPGNYNRWAEKGNDDWAWDKLEPWFKKIEDASSCHPGAEHRGHNGPLKLTRVPSPFLTDQVYEKAANKLGIPSIADANDPKAPATGYFTLEGMVYPVGERLTILKAYLPKATLNDRRSRLTVCRETVATKLEFSEDGTTVIGVHIVDAKIAESSNAQHCYVKANREVVVSCGTVFSPQLLMLSGIGPARELRQNEIPVIHDIPGVGQNLSDHLALGVSMEVQLQDSYHSLNNPVAGVWALLQWIFTRTGLMAETALRTIVSIHSDSIDDETMQVRKDTSKSDASLPENVPNLELMFVGVNLDTTLPGSATGEKGYSGVLIALTQGHSRGRISLASADPLVPPKLHSPGLTDPRDWALARKAARFATHFLEQTRDESYPFETAWYSAPGVTKGTKNGSWTDASDEEVDKWIHERLQYVHHSTSTCRMAPKHEGGVVTQGLKVHGVRNLRIADASVFPDVVNGHTVAPTVVVGERCADFISKEWERK